MSSTDQQHHFYRLSIPELSTAVNRALTTSEQLTGQRENATVIIDTLLDILVQENPNIRLNKNWRDKSEWVFNNAGGAMGSMFIVHASITEYVTISSNIRQAVLTKRRLS